MQAKILVVEDEPALLETLQYNLEHEGYLVMLADNGRDGVRLAREQQPDAILLDLMLPGIDGLEVCRLVRREMNVPIMMLTARADEIDKVVGLEVGADDYITKPFSMRELLARVKAMLRRVRLIKEGVLSDQAAHDADGIAQGPDPLVYDDLVLDLRRRAIILKGQALDLKPKEYELLAFLIRHHGMVMSRDLILERVWGWSYSGGSRTVDVHVRWLREKIEENPSQPVRIVTIRGVGYRFEG